MKINTRDGLPVHEAVIKPPAVALTVMLPGAVGKNLSATVELQSEPVSIVQVPL